MNSKAAENGWITLNVGGQTFATTQDTLCMDSNSMLAKMFGKRLTEPECDDEEGERTIPASYTDSNGAYLIDRDPQYFGIILNFLRMGDLRIQSSIDKTALLEEAQFFNITGLIDRLESMIQETDLTRRDIVKAILTRANEHFTEAHRLNCSGMRLKGIDLSGLDLSFVNFRDSDLSNAKFDGAILEGADFNGARLPNASLCRVILDKASFKHALMTSASLAGCICRGDSDASFENAILDECNFSGSSLRGCNFANSSLVRTSFQGARLDFAGFESTNLSGAVFTGAQMERGIRIYRAKNRDQAVDLPTIT